MHVIKIQSVLVCAATALILLGAESAKAGTIAYTVSFNTASVSGTSGFLDFQFNPGDNTSAAATAQVLNFNPDGGSLSGVPSTSGDVTGTLPGALTFMNDMPLNEYFQAFNYGSGFSFLLVLSGPAVGSPSAATSGSQFGIGLYDSGVNPILTNQGATTGFAGEVDIHVDGTTTATAFPPAGGGQPAGSFAQVAVPEPGTLWMLGAGLLGLVRVRRSAS